MEQPDHHVHCGRELPRTERPPLFQHQIVNVLHPQPRELTENVQRIQRFLQVNHADFDRPALALHDFAERIGRRPMAAAGVEKDEIELLHQFDCATPAPIRARKHFN